MVGGRGEPASGRGAVAEPWPGSRVWTVRGLTGAPAPLGPQASWRTQRGSTILSAAARSSVSSGRRHCVGPGELGDSWEARLRGQRGGGWVTEPVLTSSQLRVHAEKPHLLQERDTEDDGQGVWGWRRQGQPVLTAQLMATRPPTGPPGAVRHIRGDQVSAEQLAQRGAVGLCQLPAGRAGLTLGWASALGFWPQLGPQREVLWPEDAQSLRVGRVDRDCIF